MPVSLCVCFAERQAEIKERNQKKGKMPVCLCLCTFIEIRNGIKNLDLVSCTAVYIDLGKMSVTIWTNGSWEN